MQEETSLTPEEIKREATEQLKKLREKEGQIKFKPNPLYRLALKYAETLEKTEDIRKRDITELYQNATTEIEKKGELLNVNYNGLPSTGKSTAAMSECDRLQMSVYNKHINMQDIDRDQQEFSKTMRDDTIHDTNRVIDELNELELGGVNATVEIALINHLSDVQAQRFVHKHSCSPTDQMDKNAYLFIETIVTDKTIEVTHCHVYYRLFMAGYVHKQIIGYINIDVSNVLHTEWYKTYRRKKFEKMDLIIKEGIFRPRLLDYAPVIKTITEKLVNITRLGLPNMREIIQNYIKMECKNAKIPITELGKKDMTDEINGTLILYKTYFQLMTELRELDDLKTKGKIPDYLYKSKTDNINKVAQDVMQTIQIMKEDIDKMIEINTKYNDFK